MLQRCGNFCSEIGFGSSVKLVNGDSVVLVDDESHLRRERSEHGVEFEGNFLTEFLGDNLAENCVGFTDHCPSHHG